MKYNAIVVGGGIAGLTSAAIFVKTGHSVLLCEKKNACVEGDINKVLEGIPDPIGTFYRYGLAKSMLRRKVNLPVK